MNDSIEFKNVMIEFQMGIDSECDYRKKNANFHLYFSSTFHQKGYGSQALSQLNDYYTQAAIHAGYTDSPTPEAKLPTLVQDDQVRCIFSHLYFALSTYFSLIKECYC